MPVPITGVGAVPFWKVEEAVDYVRGYSVPYYPECVPLGEAWRQVETVLNIIANPGNLRCAEAFKSNFSGYLGVKGQCPGPASIVGTLMLQHKEPEYTLENALADAVPIIRKHASSQLTDLKVKDVLFVLDEPGISRAGFDYLPIWEAIFGEIREKFPKLSFKFGVHTCWPPDWRVLYGSAVDMISFNAAHAYSSEGRNNKSIMWGVPTVNEDGNTLLLEETLSYIKDFRPGDMISPQCGLAYKTEKECKFTLEVLQKAANALSNK